MIVYTSFQVFYRLVTLFNISVDQYLFPSEEAIKSTRRRQIDAMLDSLPEQDIIVIYETIKGIYKAKETEE